MLPKPETPPSATLKTTVQVIEIEEAAARNEESRTRNQRIDSVLNLKVQALGELDPTDLEIKLAAHSDSLSGTILKHGKNRSGAGNSSAPVIVAEREAFLALTPLIYEIAVLPDASLHVTKLVEIGDLAQIDRVISINRDEVLAADVVGERRGLEAELGRPNLAGEELVDHMRRLDTVAQLAGFILSYDTMRELAIPPSSAGKQLIALAELINLGLIKEGQEAFFHLNAEGVQNPAGYFREMLLLHLGLAASSFFNPPIQDPEMVIGTDKAVSEVIRKPMTRIEDNRTPKGYPVKLKNGGIAEFRLVVTSFTNFETFEKGFKVWDKVMIGLRDLSINATLPTSVLTERFFVDLSSLLSQNVISRETQEPMKNLDFGHYMNVLSEFLAYNYYYRRVQGGYEEDRERLNSTGDSLIELLYQNPEEAKKDWETSLKNAYDALFKAFGRGEDFTALWAGINQASIKDGNFQADLDNLFLEFASSMEALRASR